MITNQILQLEPKKTRKSNITEQECLALKSLTLNRDIVIKPADKAGAIVVLNTTDYINEGLRQIEARNLIVNYAETQSPKSLRISTAFLTLLKKANFS